MAVVRLETGDHQPENGFVSSETTSSGLLSRIDGYVFPCLGGFGKYQRQLVVLTCIPVLFIGFTQFSDNFLLAQPKNTCEPPIAKFENNTLLSFNNTNSSSQSLDASSTENNSSTNCLCSDGNFKTQSGLVQNVVTKWKLVCNHEWNVHIAKFSLLVGSIFGYLVLGVLADWFGRRPVLITSVLFMVVFGLTVAFSIDVTMFSTLRFFEGFCLAGITLSLYVLRIELCLPLWRFRITMVANFVVLAGQLLMPGLAALCRDWQILQAIIICPFILMVSYIWIFPESLRWLLSTQQYCRARRQMLRITRKNRVHEADVDEIFSEVQNESQKKPKKTCIVKMVGTRNLWKNIVVLCVNSLTGYGIHHCFARSMINPGAGETSIFHNFHADYYTMAGIAVASCLALCPAVGFMGRRGGLLMFMIITALASLLQLGLLNLLGKYSFKLNMEKEQSDTLNKKFSIAFSIIGMFSSHAVSNLSIFFCAEITPTVIRGGGLGLVLASAGFGMLTAPIMELHNQKGYFLHHVIFACCTLICIICILLLPETRYKPLPEHIGDGEACVRPPLLPPKKPGEQDPLLNQLDPSDRPPVQETALVGDGEINGPPLCGEDSAQSPPPCVIEVTSICTTAAPPSFEVDSACPVDMDEVQPECADEHTPATTDSAIPGATDTTSPSQPGSENTTPTTPPCSSGTATTPPCSTDTATTPPCNADTTPTTPLCTINTTPTTPSCITNSTPATQPCTANTTPSCTTNTTPTTPPCTTNTTPTTPPCTTNTTPTTPPCTTNTTPTTPPCTTNTTPTAPPCATNTTPTTPPCTTNTTPTTPPCTTNTTPTTPPCTTNTTPTAPPCTTNTTPTTPPCTKNTTPTTPPCTKNTTPTTPPCTTDTPFSPCSQDTTSAAPLLQSSRSDLAPPCATVVTSPVCSEVPSTSTQGNIERSALDLNSPTDTETSNAIVCKSPISAEPKSPNATDPKPPSCTDPKSPNVSDPKPANSMDPTTPNATDPKSTNCTDLKPPKATDPESPSAIDPESPIGTDPTSPNSTDPKSPNSTDPKSSNSTDSESPKAIDLISPKATDLISPSAMDTESSYATDPKFVIATDPKSPSATDPKCLCAIDPEISSLKDPKSPHASDSAFLTATDLKSPSATDPKSPGAIDFLSLDPGDFKSPITIYYKSPTAEESGSSISVGSKSGSAMDCLCPSAVDVLCPGATDLPAACVIETVSTSPSSDTAPPPSADIPAPGPSSDSTPPPANGTATTEATAPSSGSSSAPTTGEGGTVQADEAANGVPSS